MSNARNGPTSGWSRLGRKIRKECQESDVFPLLNTFRIHGDATIFQERAERMTLRNYSTVTDLARLRGWSTSVPMNTAV